MRVCSSYGDLHCRYRVSSTPRRSCFRLVTARCASLSCCRCCSGCTLKGLARWNACRMFFTLVSHMPVIIHHVQLQSHFDRETQLVVAQVCVKQFADLREAVFYGIVVNEERGARVF